MHGRAQVEFGCLTSRGGVYGVSEMTIMQFVFARSMHAATGVGTEANPGRRCAGRLHSAPLRLT